LAGFNTISYDLLIVR